MGAPRDETHSPVDLPGSSTLIGGHPLRWTSIAIAVATVFLLFTNATALHGWTVELPPGPWAARTVAVTERWEAFTESTGLGATRAGLHARWKEWQAARFGGEAAPD